MVTKDVKSPRSSRPATRFRPLWRVLALGVGLTAVLAGCAELALFSKSETFTGNDRLALPAPRPDILDVVADVGKALGYSVSHLDRGAGKIGLTSSTSMLTSVMIGKINQSTLTISVEDEGKHLGIEVLVMGNFGTGGQEAGAQLTNDFKAKLLERLRMP